MSKSEYYGYRCSGCNKIVRLDKIPIHNEVCRSEIISAVRNGEWAEGLEICDDDKCRTPTYVHLYEVLILN
jgi:DNA-directed RNA polymerase subunit RPC12/RpoP